MTPTTVDTSGVERASPIRDRAIDAARQVGHVSHEAQLLKSLAVDAVEDGVHAAKRAIKSVQRRVGELGNLKDEAAYRVTRQPFKALGIGAGVGLAFGLAVGWVGRRLGETTSTCSGS